MKTAADSSQGSPSKAPSEQSRRGKNVAPAVDDAEVTGQLPHERDQTPEAAGDEVRDEMRQAHKDIERGLVDTDMHATPGLDAEQREKMVKAPR